MSNIHSPCDHLKAVVGLAADAHGAGAVNGTGYDCEGYDWAMIILNAGVAGGTINVKVQESDALGSGYADITGAAFSEIDSGNDESIYVGSISLRNPDRKRYQRIVGTIATAACDASVDVILGGGRHLPVSQVNDAEFEVA